MLAGWLGKEFTVESSTLNDHMPTGGKLTFVFDSDENVVRICTRNSSKQREPWRMDFATPCGVTMSFTRGTRYCTFDDVKTGNAEVLSSCHRLRSRDIAMRPSKVKGTVELNDMIAFLVQARRWQAGHVDPRGLARACDRRRHHHRHRTLSDCARLRDDSPQRCCRSPRQQRSGRRLRSRRRRISAITAVDGRRRRHARPPRSSTYLDSLGDDRFDLRAACAQWAGTFSKRHQIRGEQPRSRRRRCPRA